MIRSAASARTIWAREGISAKFVITASTDAGGPRAGT
jgi:hypothetical protein